MNYINLLMFCLYKSCTPQVVVNITSYYTISVRLLISYFCGLEQLTVF